MKLNLKSNRLYKSRLMKFEAKSIKNSKPAVNDDLKETSTNKKLKTFILVLKLINYVVFSIPFLFINMILLLLILNMFDQKKLIHLVLFSLFKLINNQCEFRLVFANSTNTSN